MGDLKRTLDLMQSLSKNGASWIRADFHLHSPGAYSFKLPSGTNLASETEKKKVVEAYVQQLMSENIKTGAITDYQQIREDWFPLIQERALKEEIFIFPGIELSVNIGIKIHILMIFEFDQKIDAINRFIYGLDKNPDDPLINNRSHRDINLKTNIDESLRSLKDTFSCLVIFPHPSEDNGIIRELRPNQAAEILKMADAIEHLKEHDKHRLLSTSVIEKAFFDSLAFLEGSDPKAIDEIGTKTRNDEKRSTYLKVSSLSIDAFKIALHDPELRVMLYRKPELNHDHISSLEIKGSFLRDIRIDFNPEQNALIGGRGVGKSAILEALRYGLDLPIYSDASFRTEFVSNVVGSGGEIRVVVDRFYGQRKQQFLIERVVGQLPQVFDIFGKEKFEMEPREVFGEKTIPIILGQKELYHLSLDAEFQLKLIDEFIGPAIQKENLEFKKLLGELDENAKQLLQIEEKLEKLQEYQKRLATLDAHIKTFDKLKVVEKLRRHTDLMEDEKVLLEVGATLEEIQGQFSSLFAEAVDDLEALRQSLKTGKSEYKEILTKDTLDLITTLCEQIGNYKTDLLRVLDESIKDFRSIKGEWQNRIAPLKDELNKIKRELSRKGLSPEKYESVVKEKLSIQAIVNQLGKVTKERKTLLSAREQIKRKVREKRHSVFRFRKEKISQLNQSLKGRLEIEIQFEADKQGFLEALKGLCKGSKIREEVFLEMINAQNKTIDGLELSRYIGQGPSAIEESFDVTKTMAKRLCEWFSDPERLYKLERLFPEDRIVVNLKVGDEYKPLDKLSAGQKATALLLLLFAQESRILVIDQPEEDLDNRFIYEDVVKILREMKGKRQIVLATHNANIPVLGDSELVLVLNATNDVCQVEDTGSIDKKSIRDDVKAIMEGGEEAFRKRAEKYGGI